MVTKLEKMLEQKKQLEARIQNERAMGKQKQRKLETRKKILAGSYLLHEYEKKPGELSKLLDPFLTRDQDRALFGLKAKKDNE